MGGMLGRHSGMRSMRDRAPRCFRRDRRDKTFWTGIVVDGCLVYGSASAEASPTWIVGIGIE